MKHPPFFDHVMEMLIRLLNMCNDFYITSMSDLCSSDKTGCENIKYEKAWFFKYAAMGSHDTYLDLSIRGSPNQIVKE